MKYLQMLRHHCPVNEAPSKISANQEPGADGHGRGLTNQGSQKELSPIESLLQQNSPVEQVCTTLIEHVQGVGQTVAVTPLLSLQ